MGKTVEQWFLEAKADGHEWADEALENAQDADIGCGLEDFEVSLSEALAGSFPWSLSPQGLAYWYDIHDKLIAQGK